MKPSFSVIAFTVLAGAGYGLWLWLGLALALGIYPLGRSVVLVPLATGFVLVSTGLLASTMHLGKAGRAWRGFSQWRSSWLSREAVAAVACYAPMVALALLAHGAHDDVPTRVAGLVLAALSLLTVWCTARIYSSLKPIAAWRLPQVLPGYLMMSAAAGGLWLWLYLALRAHDHDAVFDPVSRSGWLLALMLLLALTLWLKFTYWHAVDADRRAPNADTGTVTGLDRCGQVRPMESPHSEENYLLREMGFVLARRHRQRLRRWCAILAFILPALLVAIAMLVPATRVGSAPLAVVLMMIGLFIERWLFFAEARHRVSAYYRGA